jgi:hypothetical protein
LRFSCSALARASTDIEMTTSSKGAASLSSTDGVERALYLGATRLIGAMLVKLGLKVMRMERPFFV